MAPRKKNKKNKKDNETTNLVESTIDGQTDNKTAKDSETSRLQTELSKANKEIGEFKNEISELKKQLQEKDDALKAFITLNENDVIATESYGLKVYRGWFGGQVKAIKKVSMEENQQYELSINRTILNYRHLLPASYAIQSANVLYFVMDIWEYNALKYIENDLLKKMIKLEPLKVVKDVLKGTARLHKLNIVHGNINTHSVRFMTEEKLKSTKNVDINKYITVISDFGLCRKNCLPGYSVSSPQYTETSYSSQEILNGQLVGRGADIFSVGVLSHYFLTGKHPYDNDLDLDVDREALERRRKRRVQIKEPAKIEKKEPIQDYLLKKMLDPVDTKRPSANELLKGPLFWDACKKMAFVSAVIDYYDSIKRLNDLDRLFISDKIGNWWNKLEDEFHTFLEYTPGKGVEPGKDVEPGKGVEPGEKIKYDHESGKDMLRAFRNLWIHFAKLRALKEKTAVELCDTMCKISPHAILRLYEEALIPKNNIIPFLAEKSFKLVRKAT